jgi:glycosyltransferase involved in cell wall biosynthesis
MVSVIVVAYNLEDIVIPTLESVARQTFSDFELIVTDDGSQDRTVEVVTDWCKNNLDPNKNPYKIVSNPGHEKRGIAGNYNRGLKVASREWLKFIDGDDLLADDCLENNIKFVQEDPSRKVVFSKMKTFENEVNHEDHIPQEFPYRRHYKFFDLSAKEQYKYFLVDSFNAAPVTFLNRELIIEVGGYDDRFFIQDLPLWLKLTSNGHKIHFLPKVTSYYRVNFGVSSSKNYIFSPIFYSSYKDMHEIMIVPNVPFYKLSFWNKYYLFRLKYSVAHKFFGNNMTEKSRKLMKALDFLSFSYSLNVFKGKILKLIRA